MQNIIDSYPSLARLKRRIAALGPAPEQKSLKRISFGFAPLDMRLGGGLARGAVHELLPRTAGDAASTAAFALMLARRADPVAPILWIAADAQLRAGGTPYGPGLAELGIAPDRLLLVAAPDEAAVLKAANDALACAGLGAVLLDIGPARRLDLTASRRLVLASERSGVTALILRQGDGAMASAAASRWQVAAAPSTPLAGQAPGRTMLTLALLRHRGGAQPFDMMVEWNNDDQVFCAPTLLRDLSTPVERRQMVA
ncbi:MAG: ImuA family protein [Chakrabartia sp.]